MLFLLYPLIGAIAGLLAGLLGIGGGIIVVPVMTSVFAYLGTPENLVMQFAAGTSLAVMTVTSLASLRLHLKFGHEIWPVYKPILPGIILGVLIGATIADILASDTLEKMFGCLLVLVAYRAYFKRGMQDLSTATLPPYVMGLGGLVVGIIAGMLGIGGGVLLVPFLLYASINMRLAVAVASACSLTVAVVGSLAYMVTGADEAHSLQWTTGYIYWPAFLGIALVSPIFASLGAKLSTKVHVDSLRRIFAVVILLAGIKLLLNL